MSPPRRAAAAPLSPASPQAPPSSLLQSPATAATRPAKPFTDTRLGRMDMDRATIPQLERLMRSGRLSSVAITAFWLNLIRRVDPLLTNGPAWTTDLINGDYFPAGSRWSEEPLLRLAFTFEQGHPVRRARTYAATLPASDGARATAATRLRRRGAGPHRLRLDPAWLWSTRVDPGAPRRAARVRRLRRVLG